MPYFVSFEVALCCISETMISTTGGVLLHTPSPDSVFHPISHLCWLLYIHTLPRYICERAMSTESFWSSDKLWDCFAHESECAPAWLLVSPIIQLRLHLGFPAVYTSVSTSPA